MGTVDSLLDGQFIMDEEDPLQYSFNACIVEPHYKTTPNSLSMNWAFDIFTRLMQRVLRQQCVLRQQSFFRQQSLKQTQLFFQVVDVSATIREVFVGHDKLLQRHISFYTLNY